MLTTMLLFTDAPIVMKHSQNHLAMEWLKHTYEKELGLDRWSWDAEDAEEIAITAYIMADEMMKAREGVRERGAP